jgi:hypothetical protein
MVCHGVYHMETNAAMESAPSHPNSPSPRARKPNMTLKVSSPISSKPQKRLKRKSVMTILVGCYCSICLGVYSYIDTYVSWLWMTFCSIFFRHVQVHGYFESPFTHRLWCETRSPSHVRIFGTLPCITTGHNGCVTGLGDLSWQGKIHHL